MLAAIDAEETDNLESFHLLSVSSRLVCKTCLLTIPHNDSSELNLDSINFILSLKHHSFSLFEFAESCREVNLSSRSEIKFYIYSIP